MTTNPTTNSDDTIPETVSTLTNAGFSPQGTSADVSTARINIGQHPTPPMRSLRMDESAYENGYDSDGMIGPFYDSMRGMGLTSYHEDEIAVAGDECQSHMQHEQNSTENAAGSMDQVSARFQLTDEQIMSLRKDELVEQCKLLGIDRRGNKGPLQGRLKKARNDGLLYLSEDEVNNPEVQQLAADGFSPLCKWNYLETKDEEIDLTDELVVNDIKYRAPTVPRDEFERTGVGNGGQSKFNFLKRIERPKFVNKALLPKIDSRGRIIKDNQNHKFIYEEREFTKSVPNMQFVFDHDLSFESEPFEWFNAFIPFKKTREQSRKYGSFHVGEWTRFTNLKAMLSNAGVGGTTYKDFTPFTTFELMKHIGIYFLNGVSPSPRVELKMFPQAIDPFNGNDMVYNSMGSNAERRHRHFKCFFFRSKIHESQHLPEQLIQIGK